MLSKKERDKLFYKNAKEALEEDKEEKGNKPLIIILGLTIVLLITLSFIPMYGIRHSPPPDEDTIKSFALNTAETSSLEELNLNSFSSIRDAIINISPEKYRDVSVRLSTSSCIGTSRVCYAKALYYYVRDKVTYINDPSSREYVQLPQKTLLISAGDCEDKSLALASMLESIGIDADIGVTSNHAFVRAKLSKATFWIKRNSDYVYLDPSSYRDFGEISFRENNILRFYEIY